MLGATTADLEGDPEAAARRKAADVELRAALDNLGDLPGRLSGQVIAYDHAVCVHTRVAGCGCLLLHDWKEMR